MDRRKVEGRALGYSWGHELCRHGLFILACVFLLFGAFRVAGNQHTEGGALQPHDRDTVEKVSSVVRVELPEDGREVKFVRLRGQAEFYWREFIDPQHFHDTLMKGKVASVVPIPADWCDYESVQRSASGGDEAHGFATYRFFLETGDSILNQDYALWIPFAFSAYRIWVNGEALGGVGQPANIGYESQASQKSAVYPLRKGLSLPAEVVLHVSNYHYPQGGLYGSIVFGSLQELEQRSTNRLFFSILVLGVGLSLLVLEIALFFFRHKEFYNISLVSTLIFLSLFLLASRPGLLQFMSFANSWTSYFKIYYVSLLGVSAIVPLVYSVIYPQDFRLRHLLPFSLLGGGLAVVILVTTTSFFARFRWVLFAYLCVSLLFTCGWMLVRAMRKKRILARGYFIATLLLFISLAISMISSFNGYIQEYSLDLFILLLFLFLFSFLTVKYIWVQQCALRESTLKVTAEMEEMRARMHRQEESLRGQNLLLARREEEEHRGHWHDEGMATLMRILGEYRNDLQGLCQSALDVLSKYLKSEISALYLARFSNDSEEGELYLVASRGLSAQQRDNVSVLSQKEGLLGSAFQDNRLHNLSDLESAEGFNVNSGLGTCIPPSLLLVPLESAVGVVGVMLFGRIEAFQNHEVDFLNRVMPSFAHSIMHTKSSVDYQLEVKRLRDRERHLESTLKECEEKGKTALEDLKSSDDALQKSRERVELLERRLKDIGGDSVGPARLFVE